MPQIGSSNKSTAISTPKIQIKQQAQNAETRPLFDTKLPSAIEITEKNINKATRLIAQKVTEGWRWISEDFINDEGYDANRSYFTSYRVVAQDNKPDQSDFDDADIVLRNKIFIDSETGKERKKFFYMDNDGDIQNGNCSARWDTQQLKKYFNTHSNDFELPSNPVIKARQMPILEEGDWVVTQGKTLRLVKADDNSVIGRLERETNTKIEDGVKGVVLADDFFEDDYVRLGGAYIRHLERSPHLEQVFEAFFDIEEVREPVKVRLATGNTQDPRTKKWTAGYRSCGDYDSYHKVTLKDKKLKSTDLRLLKKALGINIDAGQIDKNSTLENTIPFKKLLEILTFYNKTYNAPNNVPLLVHFQFSVLDGGRGVEFLLNADTGNNSSQLIISREKAGEKGTYIGNAYPYWVGYPTRAIALGQFVNFHEIK